MLSNLNNLAVQGISFTPNERRSSTPNRERTSSEKNSGDKSSNASSPTRRKN